MHADDMGLRCYLVIFKGRVLTVVCRCKHGKSSKAGPNDPYFSTSRMGRTVALTKTIFFLKNISRTTEAKTPTAPVSVCFLLSPVLILAFALKMKVNK